MSTHRRVHPRGDDDNGERLPRWSPFSHGGSHLRPNYARFGVLTVLIKMLKQTRTAYQAGKEEPSGVFFFFTSCVFVLHRSE